MTSEHKSFRWWKLSNYRLRTKLIITYTLLTVVPMTILVYLSYHQYTKSIEEQVGEYVPKILDQANRNIDKQIDEIQKLPELLYNSKEVMTILRKESYDYQSHLHNDIFIVNNYLSNTYLTDESPILGVFVFSNDRLFSSTKVSYSGFKHPPDPLPLKDTGGIILQHESDLQFKGKPHFFLITREIQDFENRKIIGTISIAVQLSFIENVFSEIRNQDEAEMWIMDKLGRIIYHTNPERIGFIEDIDRYPIWNGSFRSYVDNKRQLVSVSTLEEVDWILVHRIQLKYLTEQADLIKDVTIILFVIISLATVAISIITAWGVSRPINNLTTIMRNVEKGNFQVDIEVKSKDEIGMLTNSFNLMVARIRNLIQQNYYIEIRQKQAELYALQSQINPHFMYNTLETISMAVEEGENETVVEMVSLLGKMLRFSLSNKDRIVQFSKEVEHIRNYLYIQKYRFEERLHYLIESDIDLEQHYSPKFILQPVIENCIKHGLEKRRGRLTISINIFLVEGIHPDTSDIIIRVMDDGTGIDGDTLQDIYLMLKSDPIAGRDSGFGLINVHARIAMLFGEEYGLSVESTLTEGTVIEIRIPVIDTFQDVEKYEKKEDDIYRG